MARCINREVALASSALALGAACLLAPGRAHAQFDTHDPRTGLEGSVDLGYGTLSNGGAFRNPGDTGNGPLRGSAGLQFHLGYRIIPVLSAGLHVGWNYFANTAQSGSTDAGGGATAVGLYARLHLLAFGQHHSRTVEGTPDLFIGAGFDFFASVNQWARTSIVGINLNATVASSGLAIPFQVGFDYWITDNFGIGVLGMLAPWTAPTVCGEVNGGGVRCDTRDRESELFVYVGAGVRGRFNLLH